RNRYTRSMKSRLVRLKPSAPSLVLLTAALLAAPHQAVAQRLLGGVSPDHYDLAFTIDLPNERFDGKTGIDVRITQATSSIKLHALELEIKNATVTAGGQSQSAKVSLNAEDQTATLTVPRPIPAGRARIEVTYAARLNDKLRGLYISRTP